MSGTNRLLAPTLVLCLAAGSVSASTSLGDVVGKAASSKPAIETKELLDPAVAFRPQVRLRDAWTAEVKFEVAPGYYLYRDKLRADGETRIQRGAKGTATSRPLMFSLPDGRMVDDPTFGKVAIYDATTTVAVDLTKWPVPAEAKSKSPRKADSAVGTNTRVMVIVSQGCAAAGVCFPAQRHEFLLPVTDGAASAVWIAPATSASLGFGARAQAKPAPAKK